MCPMCLYPFPLTLTMGKHRGVSRVEAPWGMV